MEQATDYLRTTEQVIRISHLETAIELYKLTPDIEQYDVRYDRMIKRGDIVPDLEEALKKAKETYR